MIILFIRKNNFFNAVHFPPRATSLFLHFNARIPKIFQCPLNCYPLKTFQDRAPQAAHFADNNSACRSTVRIAASCRSGG